MKHTPGPWKINGTQILGADHEDTIDGTYSVVIECRGAMGGSGDTQADKTLIAAAPDGLHAAELAYLHILRTPHDTLRLEGQETLAALRDFIASATGRTSEAVQNEFEYRAIEENHKALERAARG